jgi:Tfp pilus assembly protein PilF
MTEEGCGRGGSAAPFLRPGGEDHARTVRRQGEGGISRPPSSFLLPLGCQAVSALKDRPPLVSELAPPADGTPNPHDKDLPPQEQARLQAGTAEELEKGGDELHAIALYEKARQTDPAGHQKVCRRLAVLYDRQGDFQAALAEYHKALELAPRDADLLNDLGYGYYSRGRWAESEKALRQALALKPKHQRALMNLGLCLGEQGRYAEALELFGQVVTPAQAQCNLAFVLTTQHKWPQARQAYQKALELDPDIPLARAALAKLEKAEQAPPKQLVQSAPAPAGPAAARDSGLRQASYTPPARPEGNCTTGYVQWDDPAEEQPSPGAAKTLRPATAALAQQIAPPPSPTWRPPVRPEQGVP